MTCESWETHLTVPKWERAVFVEILDEMKYYIKLLRKKLNILWKRNDWFEIKYLVVT